MLPRMTLIMPVLNRQDTIEKAIQSVISQQYPELEFIVLDGGSTDGTVEIIRKYDEHITYWHSERDGSPVAAINTGLAMATGEIIGYLMADDWYEPGILQKIGNHLIQHPEADIITCAGRIVTDRSGELETLRSYRGKNTLALSINTICFKDTSAICCRFIRHSLYKQIGVYHPFSSNGKHFFSNDKEFLLRAVLAGAIDSYLDVMGHTYYAHPESTTFSNNIGNIMQLCSEHMEIATQALAEKQLTRLQRLQLNYWYLDQSARLAVYQFIYRDRRVGMNMMVAGIKKHMFAWPVAFVITSLRIAGRKIYK